MAERAFFRIPPFPDHRAAPIAVRDTVHHVEKASAAELIEFLRAERVGGSFWAAQPKLPDGRTLLLAPDGPSQASEMVERAKSMGAIERCLMYAVDNQANGYKSWLPILTGAVDPWHLVDGAEEIWAGANQELALVATLTGKTPAVFGRGPFEQSGDGKRGLEQSITANLLASWRYRCPFSNDPIWAIQAANILADWRKLIDRNRTISAIYGVASWKRSTLDGLLWAGSGAPPYERRWQERVATGTQVAAWKSRTPLPLLAQLDQSDLDVAELEDGMIRGPGLGANCIPPLSVVADSSGIYFDPSQPSDLEKILETEDIDGELIERAAKLRASINCGGISKYGGASYEVRHKSDRRRILVVGQVEDDRSILSGGGGQTNLELLQRARSLEPDAWLIYRPHPDVEAGHRKGHVRDEDVLRHADEIDRGGSVISLIEAIDGIHCITSLAGFEALLRGKPVTTHGVPFYAGWGLTHDLASIPQRRTRRRTLDELVAASLILYPRYFDPVTRLPCSPEILVGRIARGEAKISAPLNKMRILQGKLNLALRRLREVAT